MLIVSIPCTCNCLTLLVPWTSYESGNTSFLLSESLSEYAQTDIIYNLLHDPHDPEAYFSNIGEQDWFYSIKQFQIQAKFKKLTTFEYQARFENLNNQNLNFKQDPRI